MTFVPHNCTAQWAISSVTALRYQTQGRRHITISGTPFGTRCLNSHQNRDGTDTKRHQSTRPSGKYHQTQAERLQPDGILYREEKGATQVLILDLARCRGYDTLSFDATADKKVLKYALLAHQLQTTIPAQVQVLALPVGHAGNLSEAHWVTLTEALTLTPKARTNYTR